MILGSAEVGNGLRGMDSMVCLLVVVLVVVLMLVLVVAVVNTLTSSLDRIACPVRVGGEREVLVV